MQFSVQNQPNRTVKWKQYFSNPSVWSLIASNLLIIIWALISQWSVFVIMWIYWAQSVGIGIVWFIKLISLKDFTTKDFKISDRPVAPSLSTKIKVSLFFPFHYGLFHLVYAMFLAGFSASLAKDGESIESLPIVIGGVIFLANQLFSFFYNIESDRSQKPNIGKLMFFPYSRIFPMHITVMAVPVLRAMGFGVDGSLFLILFLLLKTFADMTMHIRQLQGFADKPADTYGTS
jgi:hypothetical protein